MRVLVTGAAGFIGSSVSEALLARGDEVVGLDNFNEYYDPKVKEGNVDEVRQAASRGPGGEGAFRMIRGNLLDAELVTRLFDDPTTRPDVICHLAAWAGVRPSIQNPLIYTETNVHGTTRLLQLAHERGIRPFVFASSSSVYGARTKVPFHEEDRVDDPISPYAATKKAGELIGYTYHHLHGTRFVGLRFFTVYGPRQRPEMAIHLFARKIMRGEAIRMFGDGSSSRDYTFIDDISAGVLASIDRAHGQDGYRIYNLGCGRTTKLSELIGLIEDAVGKKAVIERLGNQPGDVPTTFASVDRAREELGYAPETPPSVGIPRFVEWLRSRGLDS
ncbi:MAG: NAD-dependent epimerase/dehydratase family protein [Myxococcota bacterium]